MLPHHGGVVRFGPFEFNRHTGELRKQGLRIRLSGKPVQLLQALIEQPGEVITREDLQKRLWQGDTTIDFEAGLNTAANRLRVALGDTAEHSHYLETLARVGYRFIAPISEEPEITAVVVPVPAQAVEELPPQLPPPAVARPRRLRWTLAAAIATVVVAAAFTFIVKKHGALPSFHQVTFRRLSVSSARFGPDGQSVIYEGLECQGKREVYLTHPSSPESRPLGFPHCLLGAVSRSGQLALITSARGTFNELLEVPLNGGSPLKVDQGIVAVDWGPDGHTMAVVRGSLQAAIEYPRGKVVYRSAGWLSSVRISPDGRQLAFVEHLVRGDDGGSVGLVDAQGKSRTLSGPWNSIDGIAWAPSGREIWFTAAASGLNRTLYSVGMTGPPRPLFHLPGTLMLYDVSATGQVLLGQDQVRIGMNGVLKGNGKESDLSWFDASRVMGLSDDGRVLLFDESGEGGGPRYSAYIRRAGDAAAVRISDGAAMALAPDGSFALTASLRDRDKLTLVPLTSGQPRTISGQGWTYDWVRVFPDGKRILAGGSGSGGKSRVFIQTLDGAPPRPVQSEYYLSMAEISPDGQRIAGAKPGGGISILPVEQGPVKDFMLSFGAIPLSWSADGNSLLIQRSGRIPAEVFHLDLKTGKYTPWKEIAPSDLIGVLGITPARVAKDQSAYAYSFNRTLSVIFVVDGLS